MAKQTNNKINNMEKTKEEILEHLLSVGYAKAEHEKIGAYLYGKGLIEFDEDVAIKKGKYDFEFFIDWVENDTDNGVLIGLFEDICKRAESAKTLSDVERYIKQIDFLMENFGLSEMIPDDENR